MNDSNTLRLITVILKLSQEHFSGKCTFFLETDLENKAQLYFIEGQLMSAHYRGFAGIVSLANLYSDYCHAHAEICYLIEDDLFLFNENITSFSIQDVILKMFSEIRNIKLAQNIDVEQKFYKNHAVVEHFFE